MVSQDLIDRIKNISPAEMENHGIINPARAKANGELTYICPYCNNGAKGKAGDGLAVIKYFHGYIYKCFSCGAAFDNISLLAASYGLNAQSDFPQICKRAAFDFGIAAENFSADKEENSARSFEDYHKNLAASKNLVVHAEFKKKYLAEIHKDLTAPNDNLEKIPVTDRRGLLIKTLREFHCRYIEKWFSPKSRVEGKTPIFTRRIIIPTLDGNHYTAVLLDSDRKKIDKKWWKMHAGEISAALPFGIETITAETEIIRIFEGEIDAMSDYQADNKRRFLQKSLSLLETFCAQNVDTGKIITAKNLPSRAFIASGSASNTNFISRVVEKCKELKIKPRFVIFYDNDSAGISAAEKLKAEIEKRGYSAAAMVYKKEEKICG